MAVIEKKLDLNSLRVGMILAEDVIDPQTSELIASKNTPLTIESIVKLKTSYLADDDTISNYDTAEEDKAILAGSIPHLAEDQRQTYVDFKNAYLRSFDNAHKYMGLIQSGEMPPLAELTKVTDEIISTVKHKSDVFTFLNYLKIREDFVYDHSVCVSLICSAFADWLKLTSAERETLISVGLLHDVGMLKISEAIIKKENKLTDEEFVKVSMHPIYGYNLVKDFEISDDIKYGILQHHERIDGSGYPNRLVGNQINRFAKIIAILDVYGAMIYDRPYREKFAPFSVIRTFEREYLGKLDTVYLMTFLQNIAYNYIDRKVRLTNDKLGTVVFINKAQCSSPIVKLENGDYVDLMFDKSVSIAEVL